MNSIIIHSTGARHIAIPKGLSPSGQGCEARATLGIPDEMASTPKGLRLRSERECHNPFRVEVIASGNPRVARSSQPWAASQNPFGILPIARRGFMVLGGLVPSLLLALLVGCAVGPNYHRPDALGSTPMPAAFGDAAITNTANWNSAEPSAHLPRGDWWQRYGDPELTRRETGIAHPNCRRLPTRAGTDAESPPAGHRQRARRGAGRNAAEWRESANSGCGSATRAIAARPRRVVRPAGDDIRAYPEHGCFKEPARDSTFRSE